MVQVRMNEPRDFIFRNALEVSSGRITAMSDEDLNSPMPQPLLDAIAYYVCNIPDLFVYNDRVRKSQNFRE